MADKSNKTEQPTHKRLEKARTEGQVAVSRDFVGAVQFVTAVSLLGAWGAWFFHQMRDVFRFSFRYAFQSTFSNGGFFQLGALILERQNQRSEQAQHALHLIVVMRRWEQRERSERNTRPDGCQRSDTIVVPVLRCFVSWACAIWR